MRSSITIVFFIFALMLSGVLLSSLSYIRKEYFKSLETKFWIYSIGLSIFSLVLFGVGTATAEEAIKSNSILFTFANGSYIASIIFQTLFCISLRRAVPKSTVFFLMVSVVVLTAHFEYLRGSGDFVGRVLEIASIISILLCVQLYQLGKTLNKYSSIQLKFLFSFTLGELALTVLRVVVSATQVNPVLTIEAIPMSLLAILWFGLGFNVLSYLTMLGFWSERSAAQQAAVSLENERISALLHEREHLIGSLLAANKSAATGALSASLAHELNQPIGASRINLFTLKKILGDKVTEDADVLEIIERIEKDNHRAGDIVGALRSAFTQEGSIFHHTSIADVLNSVISLVKGECANLGIELNVEINDAQVLASRVELQQVFLNLLNNAMDALRSDKLDDEKVIWIGSAIKGDAVQISISDSGPGVSKELAPKLFELFETRKQHGMGIGLWLSKYIIERAKGTIAYVPRTQGGSQFLVSIPLKRDMTPKWALK